MNNYLPSVDWESMLMCNLTVDTLWIAFMEILQSAVDLYVPFYTVTQTDKFFHDNKRHKYPCYIRKAMSRKNAYGDYIAKVLTTLNFTVNIKLHIMNIVDLYESIHLLKKRKLSMLTIWANFTGLLITK